MSNYCLQTTMTLKMMPKAVVLSARSLKLVYTKVYYMSLELSSSNKAKMRRQLKLRWRKYGFLVSGIQTNTKASKL